MKYALMTLGSGSTISKIAGSLIVIPTHTFRSLAGNVTFSAHLQQMKFAA
jgi:hypothetical protein